MEYINSNQTFFPTSHFNQENENESLISVSHPYGATMTRSTERSSSITHNVEPKYPPPDRGKAAWLFLAASFCVEGIVWGFPYSFGVFEKYYTNHEAFAHHPGVAAIGTSVTGVAYLLAPVCVAVLQRWPSQRKNMSILGLFLLTSSLITASFATCVVHLILSQGLLYGIGGALLYNPFLFYIDEWFVMRKGLAYGVFWAGTGGCSCIMPWLIDWGLEHYGFRITLRAWGVFVFAFLSPLIYMTKPRIPLPAHGVVLSLNLDFLRTSLFWAFLIGNIFNGMGYLVPLVFLPSYGTSIGLPTLSSTLSVSVLNLASTWGLVCVGFLTDHYHVSTVLLISAICSAIFVLVLWGLATTSFVLYIFAFTYGMFAGSYTATWTGCVTEVKKQKPETETAVVMGAFAAGRGIGCMTSGFICDSLVNLTGWHGKAAYGTKYAGLIIFTSITMLFGGIGILGRRTMTTTRPRDRVEGRHGENESLI